MHTATNDKLTHLLRQRMEDLLFEVVEMQDYLSEASARGEDSEFPLGVMGRVISTEIQNEALHMMERTEDVFCKPTIDSWERTRTSMYLNRKLATLEIFMRIIAQLPAADISAHTMAEQMANKVYDQCKKVEDTLSEIARLALAQPA